MSSDNSGESGSHKTGGRMPSLPALRCFEAAARTESFSRAADELHLTHGAVSRAVRLIEDDLGVALFDRRSRRVFLTAAGRQLLSAVREGFDLIRTATRDIRAAAAHAPLVVSCEPTLLMRWLIPRLPMFQQEHPELSVHLVAGGGPVSFDSGIDLAIRRDDFEWPTTVSASLLFPEKIGPVCRSDKVQALFADWLTLRPDARRLHSKTRPGAWATWADLSGDALHASPEQAFEHFYFSLQAAVAGLGVAIGPWHLVRDDIESGILAAPLGFVEDGSAYYLLSSEASAGSPNHAILLDWLRASAV